MPFTSELVLCGDDLITVEDYGYVMNSTICKIFGDEMTFNQLKKFDLFENEETYLVVKTRQYNETDSSGYTCRVLNFRVYFDNNDNEVLSVNNKENHSLDMIYYLRELESSLVEDEDDDEDDDEDEDNN